LTGADGHIVLPLGRINERMQLGALLSGGMAWIPHAGVQVRIEGPPFFSDATSTVQLSSPPASGGFVRDESNSRIAPLIPGTTYGLADADLQELAPTDYFWMLARAQLAADFLVAPPLKVRVAGGFNYPGMQSVGVEAVYLFRTGRVGLGPGRSQPGAPGTGPGTGAQLADRSRDLAPRRSYWGVMGALTPKWWTPVTGGPRFEPYYSRVAQGREWRVGVSRGRPLGREIGFSFVLKSFTEFAAERVSVGESRVDIRAVDDFQLPGGEFHVLVPIARIGQRTMLGGLLGIGVAHAPDEPLHKRVEGPPFYATSTGEGESTTPLAHGGFVRDEDFQMFPIEPGQTGVDTTIGFTKVSPANDFLPLARGEVALDVLVAAPFKLRFSGGFNYPGMQVFGFQAIYLFGTSR
jgi:hypothetical protein